MLSAASMEAVSHWPDKSDIVMVDQDSESVPDGSILNGLASKFTREGYNGHLWFVKGGLQAVQTSGGPLVGQNAENGDENQTSAGSMTNGGLMAGGMGRIAFQRSMSYSMSQQKLNFADMTCRLDWWRGQYCIARCSNTP